VTRTRRPSKSKPRVATKGPPTENRGGIPPRFSCPRHPPAAALGFDRPLAPSVFEHPKLPPSPPARGPARDPGPGEKGGTLPQANHPRSLGVARPPAVGRAVRASVPTGGPVRDPRCPTFGLVGVGDEVDLGTWRRSRASGPTGTPSLGRKEWSRSRASGPTGTPSQASGGGKGPLRDPYPKWSRSRASGPSQSGIGRARKAPVAGQRPHRYSQSSIGSP